MSFTPLTASRGRRWWYGFAYSSMPAVATYPPRKPNFVYVRCALERQPLVLGRDLAGAVLKLSRRIGENGAEPLPSRPSEQVDCGFGENIGSGEHNEIFYSSLRIVTSASSA